MTDQKAIKAIKNLAFSLLDFPSNFTDQFGEEKVFEMAKTKDKTCIKKIIKFIQLSNP